MTATVTTTVGVDETTEPIHVPYASLTCGTLLICWFAAYVPRAYDPGYDFDASWSDVKWVAFGCAYLLAAAAGALVLVRKRRLEG